MSLNDVDMSGVEEPKDFGAIKTTITRLRIKEIEKVDAAAGKAYTDYFRVLTELTDPSSVESVDPNNTPSSPIVNLYYHNAGSLQVLRRFIEAHGFSWSDFVGASDKEAFLQNLVGAEADAKIILVTKNNQTGEELDNPRNDVRYKTTKKVTR